MNHEPDTFTKSLFQAVTTGNVSDLKSILSQNVTLDCSNADGTTPLCIAAKCRLDLVKLLVSQGSSVNYVGNDKISALHWAIEFDNTEITTYLLEQGADINARDGLYETPLHWAAWTGHSRTAELLLRKGADPLSQNCGQLTPMDLAIRQEHDNMKALLHQFM